MIDAYNNVGQTYLISSVRDAGRYVKLDDGTFWEIDPLHTLRTMLWQPLDVVTILESTDPDYPYKLADREENDMADAAYLNRVDDHFRTPLRFGV